MSPTASSGFLLSFKTVSRHSAILSHPLMPSIASTCGISLWISSLYLSPRHPVTITALSFPFSFKAVICRMLSIDSCLASPMKQQVLITAASASSSLPVISYPCFDRMPNIISLSTVFLSHPSEIKSIFIYSPYSYIKNKTRYRVLLFIPRHRR